VWRKAAIAPADSLLVSIRSSSDLFLVLARRFDHSAGGGVDDGSDAAGLRVKSIFLA
jgi:hypothetical protein